MKRLFAKSAVILALSGKAFHFPVCQKSDSYVGMPAKGWTGSLMEMWVQSIVTVGTVRHPRPGWAKKSCAAWKEGMRRGNFASPSFLLSHQCNSLSPLLLLKGKVLLSDMVRLMSWVLCSGVTLDQQSTTVTLGNCFPKPEMCTQKLSLARSVGGTRTPFFSTGSGGPCKDTGLHGKESLLFSALAMKRSSEKGGREKQAPIWQTGVSTLLWPST